MPALARIGEKTLYRVHGLPAVRQIRACYLYMNCLEHAGSLRSRMPLAYQWRDGRMRIVALLVLVGGLAGEHQSALANSFDMYVVSRGEFAQLPEYCAQTNAYVRTPEEQRQWIAQLGPTYWHIHHYCWGLLKDLRSRRVGISAQEQRSLLESAIKECFYVLDRAPSGFVLLPEIHLRVGQFHARLGRPVEALEAFERSRTAKADYWPAYLEAARLNRSLRRYDVALELVEAGIAAMPSEQRLQDEREHILKSRGR